MSDSASDADIPGIRSIPDLEERLARGRGSFEDWSDGVELSRQAQRWDLLELCAIRALQEVHGRPIGDRKLLRAALAVAAACVGEAKTVEDADLGLRRASGALNRLNPLDRATDSSGRRSAPTANVEVAVKRAVDVLDEQLLLLVNGSSAALTQVGSWLRRELGRPDVAVVVLQRSVALDERNVAPLVSLAASLLDLDRVSEAESVLGRAETLDSENPYAARVRVKLLMARGEPDLALAFGLEAFGASVKRADLALLVTAAAAAGEHDLAMSLAAQAANADETEGPRHDAFILLEAANELIRQERWVEARRVLEELNARHRLRQAGVLLRVVDARLDGQLELATEDDRIEG